MKNLLEEKPSMKLGPRTEVSCNIVIDHGVNNKKILDIGCGYGWFEYRLLQHKITKVSGIEITKEDLDTAAKYISDKRADFKVAGALELPYEDSSFDIVVAWEVIEHIPKFSETKMFAEVARVLKPGGYFFLSTPYASISSRFLDPAWWLIGHRHYRETQLLSYGKDELLPVKVQKKGKIWSSLANLNMYVSKWAFHKKPLFGKFFLKKQQSEFSVDNGNSSIFVTYKRAL